MNLIPHVLKNRCRFSRNKPLADKCTKKHILKELMNKIKSCSLNLTLSKQVADKLSFSHDNTPHENEHHMTPL